MTPDEIQKMPIKRLESEIRRHNYLYFVKQQPEIPDPLFDLMVEVLRAKKPDAAVLREIGSDIAGGAKRVKHAHLMLSLDKCYRDDDLQAWGEKFSGDVVAMPKIDGCAVTLHYDARGELQTAATRGSGSEGEEITANVRAVAGIPHRIKGGDVEVRGEVYMPLSVFARFREAFANPRNLAAGALKQKDPHKTADYALSFFAFDVLGTGARTEMDKHRWLKKAGFPVVEARKVTRDDLASAYRSFEQQRAALDFETDGVVYRVNDIEEQERLGQTAHHPRFAIAYKFQGDSGVTKLLDVEWSVSRTGVITPVGIVEPVLLSGAMVRRTSLHHAGFIAQLGVTKGAKVLMMRRGGVIPHLEAVVKSGKGAVTIPKQCPSCGAPTELRDDFLYCTNRSSCLWSKVGELAHFVKAVEIDGFGEKLLAKLYEEGMVTDSAELYELTLDDLLQLERMGETLANKLLRNIVAKRRLPLDVFLRSLGIRELGKHAAKILAEYGALDRVRQLTEEELADVHTIGSVIAREVVDGLKKKRALIEKLLKHIEIIPPAAAVHRGPLSGKLFLFTGELAAMERSEAQKKVEGAGGIAAQSVTKDLDFLVVGSRGGAGSKLQKAEALAKKGGKVKILNEEEFLRFFHNPPRSPEKSTA